jgi:hypothetical protein
VGDLIEVLFREVVLFDEVDEEGLGGAVEDAVDELADHLADDLALG